jgi:hypothetical protein
MPYAIFVAICLSNVAPDHCDRRTAVDWFPVPEQAEGLGMCAKTGYEFAAQSNLLRQGTYPKIFCSIGKPPLPDNVS